MRRSPFNFSTALWLIAIVGLVYTFYVVLSGLGLNPLGLHWDFSVSGAFGDSFGPLNTLMAAVAAASAIAAYLSQKEELNRIKDQSERESRSSDRRDFESTFFNLLDLFRSTVKEIDVLDFNGGQYEKRFGRDAIAHLQKRIASDNAYGDSLETRFKRISLSYRDDLSHYFRLFYNILKFVDESVIENKKQYTRLFRATLSSSEITLIALNCIHGGGKLKLKPLVEKYSMLHNISKSDAAKLEIVSAFLPEAFGDRSVLDSPDPSD